MKTLWNKLLLLVWLLAPICGLRADDVFAKANDHYLNGQYEQAAAGYEALLQRDGLRLSVLHNLGETYHQLGQDGKAIFAFERGLRLRPSDGALRARLKLIREKAGLPPPANLGWWGELCARLSRRSWSYLLLAGIVLVPIAAMLRLAGKGSGTRRAALPLAALGIASVSFAGAALRSTRAQESLAVVLASPTSVRLSPFAQAEEKSKLPSGSEVTLGKEARGYYRAATHDGGVQGWISKDDLGLLGNPGTKSWLF